MNLGEKLLKLKKEYNSDVEKLAHFIIYSFKWANFILLFGGVLYFNYHKYNDVAGTTGLRCQYNDNYCHVGLSFNSNKKLVDASISSIFGEENRNIIEDLRNMTFSNYGKNVFDIKMNVEDYFENIGGFCED